MEIRRSLMTALAFFSLGGMGASGQDVDDSTDRCPREPARTFSLGSPTEITDGKVPCRAGFRKTGILLATSPDGSWPDLGPHVVRDGRGRYYSTNAPGWHYIIGVWDSAGAFLTSFGREGGGPGEFNGGEWLHLAIGPGDCLHVRDVGAWSVFSPEHEVQRRVLAPALAGAWFGENSVILDDGRALRGGAARTSGRDNFVIVNPDGTSSQAFGTVREELIEGRDAYFRSYEMDRTASDALSGLNPLVGYGGGDTFWAGQGVPLSDEPEGYVLEEWGTDGKLRRTFRRALSGYRWVEDQGKSSSMRLLHADRDGLLYILLRRGGETVFEVIDARSGVLLASEALPSEERQALGIPTRFFRGGRLGYRHDEGPEGLPVVEIIEVKLVAK